jgi:ribulose kinase
VNHLSNMAFTLGIDCGTDSVGAHFVDVSDGRELVTCVVDYPSGKQGIVLDSRDAKLARQHPGDYLCGLEKAVLGSLEQASKEPAFSAGEIIGIGVDTTGSSPLLGRDRKRRLRRFPFRAAGDDLLKPISYDPKPENQAICDQL